MCGAEVGRCSIITIYTITGENGIADNMYQQSELDYLIYSKPLEYTQLILNGDLEQYIHCHHISRNNLLGNIELFTEI